MEHKFTPGPWRTEIDNVFAGPIDHSVYVADCAPLGGPVGGLPEQIANARLIAAAPELLAALIAVRARFQHYRHGPDEEMVMDRVKAAITRATGEATPSPLGSEGEG